MIPIQQPNLANKQTNKKKWVDVFEVFGNYFARLCKKLGIFYDRLLLKIHHVI